MRKRVKWSLGMKMALIVSVAVCVVIVCSLLASRAFLGEYYLYGKQQLLIQSYNEINKQYKAYSTSSAFATKQSDIIGSSPDNASAPDNEPQIEALDSDLADSFEQMAENRSMSVLIFRDMMLFMILKIIHSMCISRLFIHLSAWTHRIR